jgi:hypothetical protein
MLSEWMLRIWRRSCSFGSTVSTIGTPIRSPRLYQNWESIQQMRVTKPEQHVWIEVVEMQPYSTTWSFPATQWRYCWLREVYKSIKTFHFSLFNRPNVQSALTVTESHEKAPLCLTFRWAKCCWASPESPLQKSVCPAIGGIERIWAGTSRLPLRCGASYNVTTITKDLEIRSEQLEFFKFMSP